MKFRTSFLLLLAILIISAAQKVFAQQNGTCCAAGWKLPLPAGQWKITQGDKDSCLSSHCAPTWEVNEYALDIVSASESTIQTLGAQILSPADGKVLDTFWDGYGGGNVLKIEHGDGGPVSIYMHLSGYLEEKGNSIQQGRPVAKIGKSGTVTGPHLHVVVFKSNTERQGLKITSWDGNSNFATGKNIASSNGSASTTPPISQKPDTPLLFEPGKNSSLSYDTEVNLKWNQDSGSTQYRVELWGGAYDLMQPCDWQSQATCHIGVMQPGTLSWRVQARNANGQESDWSETRSFTILGSPPTATPIPSKTPTSAPQAPVSPSLREPGSNSHQSQSSDIWFSWRSVSGATQYYLEYWGGPYSDLNSGWIGDTAHHIGPMWPGTYQWHVKARNSNDLESSWSEIWSFTVEEQAPADPPPLPTNTPVPVFTGNIAPRTSRVPDGIGSNSAFDGALSSFWTDGLGHSFSLELRLPDPMTINRILVWDRPQNSPDNNQINALTVKLSNGVEKRFGMDSQGARCIDVVLSSPQEVSSVRLIADDASGNNGLSEVEIWVGSKTDGPTCSNSGSMP
jgi:hypothetical protein